MNETQMNEMRLEGSKKKYKYIWREKKEMRVREI